MLDTSSKLIRVGHSPDADDAFMFYALAQKKIPMRGFEVEHVIEDRIGIFKVRRDLNDLLNMVDHIKKNYAIIVDKIYKNKLPTKKLFLDNLVKIIK